MSPLDLPELYVRTEVTIEENGRLISARNSPIVAAGVVHVITAWNPGDIRPTAEANRDANTRLYSRLVELGFEPIRAVGADPHSNHAEESWAVTGMTDEQAQSIGTEFGQVAVFRLLAGVQTVLSCVESWERSRIL